MARFKPLTILRDRFMECPYCRCDISYFRHEDEVQTDGTQLQVWLCEETEWCGKHHLRHEKAVIQ